MKKIFTRFLLLLLIFALTVPASAVTLITDEPVPGAEDDVAPRAYLSISFSNLATGSMVLSSETYHISDEDAKLRINTATWSPAASNIWIGWYNVVTGQIYYVEYSDGSISGDRINSRGVPDGDYKILIKNLGPLPITGALQYSVT